MTLSGTIRAASRAPIIGALFARLMALALSLGAVSAASAAPPETVWIGTWATAQQIPEPRNALPTEALRNATLRQTLRVSVGGERIRVLLSNAFGTEPLRIGAAHVARAEAAGSDRILPGTDRALSFGGDTDVTIPAGSAYLSDPVALDVPALSNLTISFYLPEPPAQQTSHPGSRTTSYLARGNQVAAAALPGVKSFEHWFNIARVEVEAPAGASALVTLGDSITDGRGSTTNANDRWPDRLAERLQADPRTRHIGVLNKGIGGNRLLDDGLGPNALARLERDVLSQPGVRYLVLLEGVNDLGTFGRDGPHDEAAWAAHVDAIIDAYGQIVARARADGLFVVGATIMPYGGFEPYKPDALSEAARQAVNRWIRTPGNVDAVADFDRLLRDPERPDRLRADYDVGDHLHPSPAAFKVMADAIPLPPLRR